MFERFTDRARTVVTLAGREADALGHPTVGTEHLLLAMFDVDGGVAHTVLRAHGLEKHELRDIIVAAGDDATALRSIGIDLDAVRGRVEETFGPGALDRPEPTRRFGFLRKSIAPTRFNHGAKKALELALRVALMLGHNYIGTEHLLLGVLKEERGPGARLLREQGMTFDNTLVLVRTALKGAA